MSNSHILYINNFKKYEPTAIQANTQFDNLSKYSTFIHNKANEIFSDAARDNSIDSMQLQKEITELGIIYVKLFIAIRQGKVNIWTGIYSSKHIPYCT